MTRCELCGEPVRRPSPLALESKDGLLTVCSVCFAVGVLGIPDRGLLGRGSLCAAVRRCLGRTEDTALHVQPEHLKHHEPVSGAAHAANCWRPAVPGRERLHGIGRR
ncbi:MAG: hypothetical protein LC772_08650 [Chloroflexi bacterium]|nr:hypothetical protein [Chloroflexota bacterium]